MTADRSLAELRQEIDDVDDALHDLVMRRAALVAEVAAAKRRDGTAGTFLRPGREATILRRIVARNGGDVPPGALVRLWRELLCAMLPVQGPFSVAVAGGSLPIWDAARDFYGSETAMRPLESATGVIDAVTDGSVTVGIVSATDGQAIRTLGERDGTNIVMRLPFAPMRADSGPRADAFVLARIDPEESGEDRTVLLFDGPDDRRAALGDAGLAPVSWRSWTSWSMAEIEGFHFGGRGRRFDSGALTARVLGSYPAPLAA